MKGETINASAVSKFLVAEAKHRAVIFRKHAEDGANVSDLEDFVCARGLGLSGFYVHSTADFEVVAVLDRPRCLMTVDAVLYRLTL